MTISERRAQSTHAEQHRASKLKALSSAGIGRSYADKSLDQITPQGPALKEWLIANHERFDIEGYGVDFRGQGPRALDIVNLTAKAFLAMNYTVQVLPLVRLPRLLADAAERDFLVNTTCLVIRDFETPHECPLRNYEIAEVEAFLTERFADARSVTVWRHGLEPRGWWSGTVEGLIEENTSTREVGR